MQKERDNHENTDTGNTGGSDGGDRQTASGTYRRDFEGFWKISGGSGHHAEHESYAAGDQRKIPCKTLCGGLCLRHNRRYSQKP